MNNDDLLYSNMYISDPNVGVNYDITPELRNSMLIDHVQNPEHYQFSRDPVLLNADIGRSNPVLTDDGVLKPLRVGALHKEQRKILAINSNQRKFFTEELLQTHSPEDFKGYISTANYTKFASLYNIAIGATSTVQTYADYIKKNNITLVQVAGSAPGARLLVSNLLRDRLFAGVPDNNSIAYINDTLLDILANIVTTEQGLVSQGTIANELNVLAMTGTAYNPSNYWRPFRYTADGVKIILYKDQHPNNYTVILPSILTNVKSIRLISTEIPNSINNINERNNIIVLKLRMTSEGHPPISIDPTKSAFNFMLIQLDIGIYTTEEILKHMEDKLNATVSSLTINKKYGSLFTIIWNKNTGSVNIKCNRADVQFHLKFYAELADQLNISNPGIPTQILGQSPGTVVNYWHDLWYMLGFPWPYEIDETGADLYTSSCKNVVNYGLHKIFDPYHNTPADLFDRKRAYVAPALPLPPNVPEPVAPPTLTDALAAELNLTNSAYDELNVYHTYRYPDVGYKYIYLVLVGYKCISHINQHNNVINFTDNDIFAKVLINCDTGKIANNSFVSNPLIFTNIIDKIELLTIQWIDETGALVDFNDVDHSFTLEVIQYITQVESTGYNSGIGTIDGKSYPDYLSGGAH